MSIANGFISIAKLSVPKRAFWLLYVLGLLSAKQAKKAKKQKSAALWSCAFCHY
ncbi:hypothetical protein [Rufibacter sp. XAAS-G3-1]|uniref:hypothetical protein n=1 Tax=Rufibacter sp. XAAS-G3-1 TaxID=2729134 RepID=UPI0015E75E7D|nr:hypothetical protein [Rufibacter sp. XAAS-G3-1]